ISRDHTCSFNIPWNKKYQFSFDPTGIFDLVEMVGNGTYGQVYKVRNSLKKVITIEWPQFFFCPFLLINRAFYSLKCIFQSKMILWPTV
uniref:Protein kinase domain-containing protein n=1 Tax=Kryptolebias marmoratus TaxID=37003 RepID=A0A3Q3AA99_KRYMA